MPASPTDISLNINILVKTGDSASCSCCFPRFQRKNKLVTRKYNEQGRRNMLKHHTVKYTLTFHQGIQETRLKMGKQRERDEFRKHRCLCTVQPPCWESLPSPRIQTFKNPSTRIAQTHGCQSCFGENGILPRIQHQFQLLLSIFISTLNFYFYSVNLTTNRNKLPKFHVRVQFN